MSIIPETNVASEINFYPIVFNQLDIARAGKDLTTTELHITVAPSTITQPPQIPRLHGQMSPFDIILSYGRFVLLRGTQKQDEELNLSNLPSHITKIFLSSGIFYAHPMTFYQPESVDAKCVFTISKPLKAFGLGGFNIHRQDRKAYFPNETLNPIESYVNPLNIYLPFIQDLEFVSCELDTLDWLPIHIQSLRLKSCSLLTLSEGNKNFSLKTLNKIKKITLDSCKNVFFVEFPSANNQVESLKILRHNPRPTDDTFRNFPQTLREFEIMGADITDNTVEKLENNVQTLELYDCPKVNVERIKLLFPWYDQGQQIEREPSKTDIFRRKLEQAVIGQPQAIDVAFNALCVSLSGIIPNERPSGVFLFVGPSGVGKTELAKAIANAGDRHFLRYDMAEYQLQHEVAKLIGSPRGFEGNLYGSKLTNDIQKHPNAIVLFDEIEKAHHSIFMVLLGILDAGRMTDNQDRTVDFTKTIIIMTSNLGAREIANLDWNNTKEALEKSKIIVLDLLKQKVAPEFAGRIDTVVPFRPLEEETIKNIMKSKIQRYEENVCKTNNIQIKISENVWLPLLKTMDPTLGARPVIRQIEQEINSEIGKGVLNGIIKKGDKLDLQRENGKIKIQLIRMALNIQQLLFKTSQDNILIK